jgi:hypothetical protein
MAPTRERPGAVPAGQARLDGVAWPHGALHGLMALAIRHLHSPVGSLVSDPAPTYQPKPP